MPEPRVDDDDVLGTDEQEALDRKPNPNARSPRRDGTAAVDLERAEIQNLDLPRQASAPPCVARPAEQGPPLPTPAILAGTVRVSSRLFDRQSRRALRARP